MMSVIICSLCMGHIIARFSFGGPMQILNSLMFGLGTAKNELHQSDL